MTKQLYLCENNFYIELAGEGSINRVTLALIHKIKIGSVSLQKLSK